MQTTEFRDNIGRLLFIFLLLILYVSLFFLPQLGALI